MKYIKLKQKLRYQAPIFTVMNLCGKRGRDYFVLLMRIRNNFDLTYTKKEILRIALYRKFRKNAKKIR